MLVEVVVVILLDLEGQHLAAQAVGEMAERMVVE
jgi:hypothetical protein